MASNIEAVYPLSPVQQGMLFHCLYEPDAGLYIGQYSAALEGELDVPAFEQAWQQVVQRHTILRSAFVWEDLDEPMQVVGSRAKLPVEVLDWRDLSPERQQSDLETFLEEDRQRKFQLTRAPLMRVTIIRMADDIHHLVWTSHHLVIDGWSRQIILAELFAFYDAIKRNEPIAVSPARSYEDFISWLKSRNANDDETFWRNMLGGLTTPTDFAVGRALTNAVERNQRESERGLKLTPALTAELQAFARRNHLTLNTIIQGVWALLLSRYSGDEDVVFGTVLPGRAAELAGVESMVGVFMNTLPVRVKVPPGKPLVQWMKELQTLQLELFQHQHTSLQKLREWTDIPATLPLFVSVVAFQNYPVATSVRKLGLNLKSGELQGVQSTNYPLLLRAGVNGQLWLRINYFRSRFDDDVVESILEHYRHLLEGLLTRPEQTTSSLSMLTEKERSRLVVEWNDTAAEFPNEMCIHEFFENNAERTPDAVALICGEETLSYAELNQRANRLAHYLRRLGVKPNSLVGICVERSVEMVLGLLSIAKAGAAYVPLDPGYPLERLSFMLDDTKASVLLTQEYYLGSLPDHDAHVVCLDRDWPAIASESQENPKSGVTPENLVYVIFTSGSTGKPKGVMLDHRGRVNNFHDFNQRFKIGRNDRLLAISSPSFDMSAYDVFGTLMAGGTIVIPEASLRHDPKAWAELMNRHRVTIWHSVPALLEMLVDYLEYQTQQVPDGLRLVLLGGDWIPLSLPGRLRNRSQGVELISMGGATEASMDSTIYSIDANDPTWKSIPYGRPMTNQLGYILDANLNLVPVGVPGELHLGGVGLAWGYLNRPDLTAEKFIPHPVSTVAGSRVYKTGDLARYMPDGNLELLGRMDNQVKVRGFRIELGEIETELRKLVGVREALVMPQRDEQGENRLVAYIIPAAEQELPLEMLRSALKERLPEQMIPSLFVTLEKFPLTPNGKIDRKNLPKAAPASQRPERTVLPPRNVLEESLAQKWCEVLGEQQIGIDDDFFALGGDSIKAMKACYVLGTYIPIIDLYQHPTIRQLAAHLSAGTKTGRQYVYELTRGTSVEGALNLICVPYGGGNVVAYQPLANELSNQLNVYSLALPGHDLSRQDEALRPVEETAKLCVDEIMATVNGPIAVYGHCSGSVLAVEIARLLEEAGVKLECLILAASLARPSKGPTEPQYSNPLLNYSDAELHQFLISLDAFQEIPATDLGFVMNSVRHDSRCIEDYFQRAHTSPKPKLRAQIFSLIGEADPLTSNYMSRYRMWEIFSDSVTLHVVAGGGHYFLKHNASNLAQIIKSILGGTAQKMVGTIK